MRLWCWRSGLFECHAHPADDSFTGHGGSERQLANIALSLDRSLFFPHVASVTGGFQADELRRAGVPVVEIPLRSFMNPSVFNAGRYLRDYIRGQKIRLVHTFDYTLSLLGIPVAKTCPGVVALSSQRYYMELVPAKYKWPLMLTHRMADGVVANCEEMRRHLVNDYSYPANRTAVCYNGIDTGRFFAADRARLPAVEGVNLVIGTVCVLRPEKNVGQLLEAFAHVGALRPGMKLLIVGSGPEKQRLEAMSVSLGVAEDCVFLPSTADAAPAFRSIDIFVHPSLSEGLPNAVMEAMACGCAVVASRVGGCAELIEEGESGFLTKAADLDSLTGQLSVAIEQDELRRRVAAAAAERMKDYSLARSALCMQRVYQSYLD